MVNKKQEPDLSKNRKKFLEDLQRQNGAGQGYIDYVLEQSKAAPKELNDAAEATRKATEIMKDEEIQKKLSELSEVISEKLDPTKLLGDSPHKDKVDYFVKHADEYVLDEKTGNYILREVVKQVSAQLVMKSKESMKQETKKDDREQETKKDDREEVK